MTQTDGITRRRAARPRTYLMCPPEYFAVEYAINPWMNPDVPADTARATRQWQPLRRAFVRLGHTVRAIDPQPGLPDMVFAANGATVIGGKVLGARFRYPQRAAEGEAYLAWFTRGGDQPVAPRSVNEGGGAMLFT